MTDATAVAEYVRARRAEVEAALSTLLPAPKDCPPPLAEAMRYSLTAGGNVSTTTTGNQTIGTLNSTGGGISLTSGGTLTATTLTAHDAAVLRSTGALSVTGNLTAANAVGVLLMARSESSSW